MAEEVGKIAEELLKSRKERAEKMKKIKRGLTDDEEEVKRLARGV